MLRDRSLGLRGAQAKIEDQWKKCEDEFLMQKLAQCVTYVERSDLERDKKSRDIYLEEMQLTLAMYYMSSPNPREREALMRLLIGPFSEVFFDAQWETEVEGRTGSRKHIAEHVCEECVSIVINLRNSPITYTFTDYLTEGI